MRYLLILVVALALTIAWQTSVVADIPTQSDLRCDVSTTQGGHHAGTGLDVVDCR